MTYANLPIGESKAHSVEVQVNRRLSNGLTGFFSFAANSVRYNRTVEEYEREPTLWQGSNDARPWRLAGAASYELPFGSGKPFLSDGGMWAALASNWQLSGTWEYQPGALLDWGGQNIFFYGDLNDIDVDNPTRDRWFNIDAGFERDPAKTPAAFQKRAFPFRVDGVRSMPVTFANLSVQRSFGAGGSRTGSSLRRTEHLQPSAVARTDAEPDQHAVRPGDGGGAEPDALLHLRRPGHVLTSGAGPRRRVMATSSTIASPLHVRYGISKWSRASTRCGAISLGSKPDRKLPRLVIGRYRFARALHLLRNLPPCP